VNSPAAGWYPDPAGSARLRYWTGSHWTEQMSGEQQAAQSCPDAPARPAADRLEPPPVTQPVPPPEPGPARSHPAAARPWHAPAAGTVSAAVGPDGQALSGPGRRMAAALLDWTATMMATVVAAIIVVSVFVGWDNVIDSQSWSDLMAKVEADPGYQPSEAEALAVFGSAAVSALLWAVGLWTLFSFCNGVILVAVTGQTVGDRICANRRVVRGRRIPGPGAAMTRWGIPAALLLTAPFLFLLPLGVWLVDVSAPLWDPQRRTWHDRAAGTVVERADLIGPPQR
jgi:hypothetical protein